MELKPAAPARELRDPLLALRASILLMTLNPFRFAIVLDWSQQDTAFVAEIPELPGCAADGATYQEALANAEVIIREWIETARELGRPIPEPRGKLMFA